MSEAPFRFADDHTARMAYAEARLCGENDLAYRIAINRPDAFEWSGEEVEGVGTDTDWSADDEQALLDAGRIHLDAENECYRRGPAPAASRQVENGFSPPS